MVVAGEIAEAGTMEEQSSSVVARFVPSENTGDAQTQGFFACHRIALAELPAHRVRLLLEAADGSPVQALGFPPSVWKSPPISLTDRQITRLSEAKSTTLDSKLLERATRTGTYALLYRDEIFPANLFPLTHTPPMLFVRGELLPEDRFGIAIVGTRRSSPYGDTQATRFAGVFATNGLTVISGGAAGIDAAAHTGALNAGGRTIAVLGCGADIVYPAGNRDLFARIVQEGNGALVTEFALGTKPEPWRFPTRNRIIAGLARASVLIETPDDSGALGTAKSSAEYGRDVYVVPGPIDSGRSRGGHRLIGDGAILADSPEDVLLSLGVVLAAQEEPKPLPKTEKEIVNKATRPSVPVTSTTPNLFPAPPPSPPVSLPPDEAAFFSTLSATPKPFDTITQEAGLSSSQANVAATLLEMKTLIRRHPGNLFSRI